jgi:hypothetical protein
MKERCPTNPILKSRNTIIRDANPIYVASDFTYLIDLTYIVTDAYLEEICQPEANQQFRHIATRTSRYFLVLALIF